MNRIWNPTISEVGSYDENLNKQEVKQMGSIREEATEYEPKQTKTVDELERVSLDDINLIEDTYEIEEDGKPKKVTQRIFSVDGEEYRVPNSVLKDLKVILKDNPNLNYFKVIKEGEGLKTSYTVIPIIE